ncbi:hypothetical protein ABFV80_003064 [Vandammella animalimorsus]|uniref:hypothetical protein n=1 Tax=Vandammella animalimorsus TaxID=2029117 RepID=UPI00325B07BF
MSDVLRHACLLKKPLDRAASRRGIAPSWKKKTRDCATATGHCACNGLCGTTRRAAAQPVNGPVRWGTSLARGLLRLGLQSGFSRQKPQMQGENACKAFNLASVFNDVAVDF